MQRKRKSPDGGGLCIILSYATDAEILHTDLCDATHCENFFYCLASFDQVKWVETFLNATVCFHSSLKFWGFKGFKLLHLTHMSVYLQICKILLSKNIKVSMAPFYQYTCSRGTKLIILAPCSTC